MLKKKKKTKVPAVCALILSAGSSRRMGSENKQLIELSGMPVLARTLKAFEKCALIKDIVLVCREQDITLYAEIASNYGITKLRSIVRGGETRTRSALLGLYAVPESSALIAVHDGARPLVSEMLITEAVTTAAEYGGAAPVVPIKDSIKRVKDGIISADVPRESLYAVQTPQVFKKDILLKALENAVNEGKSYTDDCAAVKAMGQAVKATHGSYDNIKLTTPEDIKLAQALMNEEF